MDMLTDFGKVLIFMITGGLFVGIALVVNRFLRPNRPTVEKLKTYECGEEAIGSPWIKFNIRFYVIALIFLLFEVEITLLIPWALTYRHFGIYGFLVGIIFLVILILGMLYEWKKGDLEWVRPEVPPKDLKTIQKEFELKTSKK